MNGGQGGAAGPAAGVQPVGVVKDRCDGLRHTGRVNGRAVLFVHGFIGDRAATWTKPGELTSFPTLIANDDDLADHDVYQFGYKTSLWRGSRVELLAKELNSSVEALLKQSAKRGREYSLVLVAHSLGGLVCMRYVLDLLAAGKPVPVSGLLLYGTPTTGTDLIRLIRLFGIGLALKFPPVRWLTSVWFNSQRQLTDLGPASDFLMRLHDEWVLRVVNGGHADAGEGRRMWLPVRVVSADRDFVVSEASAKGVYGAIDWQSVPYGHVDLVKPAAADDERYLHAKDFLERCRAAPPGVVLDRVWGLSQAVWRTHAGKLIRDLDVATTIHPAPGDPSGIDPAFVAAGFSPVEVYCKYRSVLEADRVTAGIAVGRIAQDKVVKVKPEPAYVHQLGLGGLGGADQTRAQQTLAGVMKGDPAGAWDALFPSFTLEVDGTRVAGGAIDRDPIPPYEWLRRTFPLPPALAARVGEEVEVVVRYRSLVPAGLTSFRFVHNWLTHGSACRITVHGRVEYFIPTARLTTGQRADPPIVDQSDQTHSVLFKTTDTVVPGSSFDVVWRPAAGGPGPAAA